MKRGQIAVFVIVAIIIVTAIASFVYIRNIQKLSAVNPDVKPINSFIESCIKSTGEDALIFIGQHGGYYNPPSLSINNIPIYFYNNKSYFPSKEKIESEISLYINEMLPFCTRNFQDFSDFQIDADPSAIEAKTTISSGKVIFEVDWTVAIKKAGSSYALNSFSSETASRLDSIYNLTENFMRAQIKNPPSICLSCLTMLGVENDVYVDMEDYDLNSVIFTITDKNVSVKNQEYKWIFINYYQ
jgi:hypothetical protein